jgi:hypothetical protein
MAPLQLEISANAVDQDMLLPPPGAQFQEISGDLDGHLKDFGGKAAKLFQSLLKRAGTWPSSPITEIRYQDAFVASPFVARLFLDTCTALVRLSNGSTSQVRLETRPARRDALAYSPFQAFHDWEDSEAHAQAIAAYGARLGLNVVVAHGQAPHGRYLTISFENGARGRVILDQGFGAWRLPRGARLAHPFEAPAQKQAASMAAWNAAVTRTGVGSSYAVASDLLGVRA